MCPGCGSYAHLTQPMDTKKKKSNNENKNKNTLSLLLIHHQSVISSSEASEGGGTDQNEDLQTTFDLSICVGRVGAGGERHGCGNCAKTFEEY